MVKCNKCGVTINTSVKICPLCKNELNIESDKKIRRFSDYINLKSKNIQFGQDDVYPYIEPSFQTGLWQKVLSAVVLLAIVFCTYIDFAINDTFKWSVYVNLALLCVVVSIAIGVSKKRSLSGLLFGEYIFLVIACIFWDFYIGYHGWSLNYVFPILSPFFIILNYILRFVFKRDFLNYYRNILVAGIISISAIILYKLQITEIGWLSYISGLIGIISLIVIVFIDGKKVKQEVLRRLHV